eukprot:2261596-Rhodomonas_salina.1
MPMDISMLQCRSHLLITRAASDPSSPNSNLAISFDPLTSPFSLSLSLAVHLTRRGSDSGQASP